MCAETIIDALSRTECATGSRHKTRYVVLTESIMRYVFVYNSLCMYVLIRKRAWRLMNACGCWLIRMRIRTFAQKCVGRRWFCGRSNQGTRMLIVHQQYRSQHRVDAVLVGDVVCLMFVGAALMRINWYSRLNGVHTIMEYWGNNCIMFVLERNWLFIFDNIVHSDTLRRR